MTISPRSWSRPQLLVAALLPAVLVIPGTDLDAAFFAPKALGLAIVALGLAIAAAAGPRSTPSTAAFDAVDAACGALALFLVVAAVRSPGGLAGGASALVLDLSALALFAVLRGRATRASSIEDVVTILAWVLVVPVLLEALGVVWIDDLPRRPVGLLGNRNTVAHLLALLSPLLVSASLRARRIGPFLARGLVVTIVAATIALTRCRGAWIASVAGMLITVVSRWISARGGDVPRRAAGLCAVAALSFALSAEAPWPGLHWNEPSSPSLEHVVDVAEGTGRERIEDASIVLAQLEETPLFGAGLSSWSDVSARHAHAVPHRHASRLPGSSSPLSDVLRLLIELGLVGTLLVAAALVTLARRSKSASRVSIPRGAIAGVGACLAISMLVDVPWMHAETLAVLAIVAAALAPRAHPARSSPARSGPARSGRIALVAACALLTMLATVRVASGQIALHGASEEAIALADTLWPDAELRLALASRADDPVRALARCEAALAIAPSSYAVLLAAAGHAARLGLDERAEELRARALAIEPHAYTLERARRARRAESIGVAPR